MMTNLKKPAAKKTRRTGFVPHQSSLRARAIEACGLPADRLRQMAGAIAGGFAHFADADDLIGEAWLMQLENPSLSATQIAAYVVKVQTQKRGISIGAGSLDHCGSDEDGESRAMQIAAPEEEEMEQWRTQELDLDIDGLREEMKKHGRVGDRRIRQILQAATERIASNQQPNLFGMAF